jgi:hypothetical protein
MSRILFSFMLLIASFSTAYAQSNNVRLYCAYDYMRHCSAYSLTSPNLAKCMANVGVNLSKKCIQALVDDGLITKQDVISRAAKEGIVVRDGANGLYVDENAKVGEQVATVEMPKETITAKDVPDTPVVADKKEVGKETKDFVYDIPVKVKKAVNTVKRTVKKAVTAVKTKYNKVTKSNKDYAGRNIAPEGINADFGRYEMREPGFVPPVKYDFKKRMESRDIYSSGVNGY